MDGGLCTAAPSGAVKTALDTYKESLEGAVDEFKDCAAANGTGECEEVQIEAQYTAAYEALKSIRSALRGDFQLTWFWNACTSLRARICTEKRQRCVDECRGDEACLTECSSDDLACQDDASQCGAEAPDTNLCASSSSSYITAITNCEQDRDCILGVQQTYVPIFAACSGNTNGEIASCYSSEYGAELAGKCEGDLVDELERPSKERTECEEDNSAAESACSLSYNQCFDACNDAYEDCDGPDCADVHEDCIESCGRSYGSCVSASLTAYWSCLDGIVPPDIATLAATFNSCKSANIEAILTCEAEGCGDAIASARLNCYTAYRVSALLESSYGDKVCVYQNGGVEYECDIEQPRIVAARKRAALQTYNSCLGGIDCATENRETLRLPSSRCHCDRDCYSQYVADYYLCHGRPSCQAAALDGFISCRWNCCEGNLVDSDPITTCFRQCNSDARDQDDFTGRDCLFVCDDTHLDGVIACITAYETGRIACESSHENCVRTLLLQAWAAFPDPFEGDDCETPYETCLGSLSSCGSQQDAYAACKTACETTEDFPNTFDMDTCKQACRAVDLTKVGGCSPCNSMDSAFVSPNEPLNLYTDYSSIPWYTVIR
jgi:hypothetical protein